MDNLSRVIRTNYPDYMQSITRWGDEAQTIDLWAGADASDSAMQTALDTCVTWADGVTPPTGAEVRAAIGGAELTMAKRPKIAATKKLAEQIKYGGITVATKPMATDQDAQNKVAIIGAALSQGQTYPPAGISFYTMEGERFVLDSTQFATLAKNMAIHLVNCDTIADGHEDAINALATVQDVNNYDETAGYPSNPVI